MDKADRIEARRQARAAWCAARRRGDSRAVFRPGEELRCPGTIAEAPCGASLGEFVKPGTRVIVRVRSPFTPTLSHAGTDLWCKHCQAPLEKFAILEATG